MAHSTNIISSIKLPNGTTYEIHDKEALHSIEDLGLAGVLYFKGVVDVKENPPSGKTALPTSGNRIGDVYHVKADDYEYVWATVNGKEQWEEFGAPHDFVGTTQFNNHKHGVSASGKIEPVTSTGSVVVPSITAKATAVTGIAEAQGLTFSSDKVLGEGTSFTTTVSGAGLGTVTKKNVGVTISPVAVASDGTAQAITSLSAPTKTFMTGATPLTTNVVSEVTPSTGAALTGLGTPTIDAAVKTLATASVTVVSSKTDSTITVISSKTDATASKIGTTALTIPNVTSNTNVTASNITSNADVTASKINTNSSVTASSVTMSVSNGVLEIGITGVTATNTAYTDVTATKTAYTSVTASKTSLGNAFTVNHVTSNTDVAVSKVVTTTADVSKVVTKNATVVTGTGSTFAAVTGYNPSASTFVTDVTTASATVLTGFTPLTATAVTSVTTKTSATVLTGVKVSTQPTVDIEYVDNGGVTVVTDVAGAALSATTTADTNDIVQAVTGGSAEASKVSLNTNVYTEITIGATETPVSVTAPTITVNVSGETGTPQ